MHYNGNQGNCIMLKIFKLMTKVMEQLALKNVSNGWNTKTTF